MRFVCYHCLILQVAQAGFCYKCQSLPTFSARFSQLGQDFISRFRSQTLDTVRTFKLVSLSLVPMHLSTIMAFLVGTAFLGLGAPITGNDLKCSSNPYQLRQEL